MQFAGLLMLIFATAIGTATFIENDWGTTAAQVRVYHAKWFEILLLITSISLIGSIFKYKLYQRKKLTLLVFHISFVIILIGAAITRYIGYEGMLRIREGESSNELISDQAFVQVKMYKDGYEHAFHKSYLFSQMKKNRFNYSVKAGDDEYRIRFKEYIPNAAEVVEEAPNGVPVISFALMGEQDRRNAFMVSGESYSTEAVDFVFDKEAITENTVLFTFQADSFYFVAPFPVIIFSMMENRTDTLVQGVFHPLETKKLYTFNGQQVVFRNLYKSARTRIVSAAGENGVHTANAISFEIEYKGEKEEFIVNGGKGILATPVNKTVGDAEFAVGYGSRILELPFSLYLKDFQLERYPGSNSPSSYASEVILLDPKNNIEMPYRIYMNNVLNHEGFRFFQSSYDQDERGTILSVNRDYYGTLVTYIGYLFLTFGFFLNFFDKKSRFQTLARASKKMRELQKKSITAITIFLIVSATAIVQTGQSQQMAPSGKISIDADHAARFGNILIQEKDGRIEPLNTFTSEVLRKVYRKGTFEDLNSDQVFLGMASNPVLWQSKPIIKVGDKDLKQLIGISGKYASFNDFIDDQGYYKLSKKVEEAYNKKPGERNRFDKDIISVDERVNIIYMVYTGDFLNIFPHPDDSTRKWYGPTNSAGVFDSIDGGFVENILPLYFQAVNEATVTGDYSKADEFLNYISTFQNKYGADIIPPVFKTKLEIAYNKYNIFKRLFPVYALTGFIMIILLFINILNARFKVRWPILILTALIALSFLLHTLGLAARWYIAGRAPWSNGYETMIYISWAIVLSGFLFARRSMITLATTAILASLTLMVANLSWLDPEITNLVPVLKSYWLVIHVAVITASYSFLGIGALLGFLNLLLFNFQNKKNFDKLNITIKELTNINEMNLIIGVFLVTIGTFLGAVWANESWGRYWGWDPKETWALVTVLVYSFVVHMRLIPSMNSIFAFNLAALISFSSVLMTYFGVNYYLSGLHSYAKGDPVPIPTFVYYTVAIILIVSVMAYFNYKKLRPESQENKENDEL